MAKESEISRRLTRAVKAGDKLVQDVRKDIKEIKDSLTTLKDSFKKPGSESKD